MTKSKSYVYFAFHGDEFDPEIITSELGISPSDSWEKGDLSKYIQQRKYSCWKLTSTMDELLDMDKLVHEVLTQLSKKTEQINKLKKQLSLDTLLQVVMYVDFDDEMSTPFIGHDLETIDFLYKTKTKTDIDIYKYHSMTK